MTHISRHILQLLLVNIDQLVKLSFNLFDLPNLFIKLLSKSLNHMILIIFEILRPLCFFITSQHIILTQWPFCLLHNNTHIQRLFIYGNRNIQSLLYLCKLNWYFILKQLHLTRSSSQTILKKVSLLPMPDISQSHNLEKRVGHCYYECLNSKL